MASRGHSINLNWFWFIGIGYFIFTAKDTKLLRKEKEIFILKYFFAMGFTLNLQPSSPQPYNILPQRHKVVSQRKRDIHFEIFFCNGFLS